MTSTPNNSISSQHHLFHSASSVEEDFGSEETSVKSEPRQIVSLRSRKLQKRSLTDYHKKELYNDGLFPTQLDSFLSDDRKSSSLLSVTASKLKQLPEEVNELQVIREETQSRSSHTQTESSGVSSTSKKVQYLLQQKEPQEEEESRTAFWQEESNGILLYKSEAMKSAEYYLQTHNILDFFQFLIAHLAAARSDNPIEFLLSLLNKILLYRSGMCHPPVLYEKTHLEQLVRLMDRMRTGFIEMQQYKSGMQTLGICTFNLHPPLTSDGLVANETFINEAYECLIHQLNEMIKRRGKKPFHPARPVPTVASDSLHNEPHFIPPELFLRMKHESDIVKYVVDDNGE